MLFSTRPPQSQAHSSPKSTETSHQDASSVPIPPNSQAHTKSKERSKALSLDTINPAVLKVQYAVRGELAIKADKYQQQLDAQHSKQQSQSDLPTPPPTPTTLPFKQIVTANIGNPQQRGLDQKPITFWRQVSSLCEYPDLLDHPLVDKIYPSDVIERARQLLKDIGSVGAYSHSKGVLAIRKKVAKFIEERDGHPSDPEHIFLTAGASAGVAQIMNLVLQLGEGVLIPIPQYPLYTATLAALSCTPLPYNLSEPAGWSLSHEVLQKAVDKAKEDDVPVKALVVINPGNPTGGCLSREDMEAIVQMCYDESILLMADEVYQKNIYDPENKPFISFKKVVMEMKDEKVRNGVELISFHSISKGVSGECGRRGGYFELVNIDDKVLEQLYKMASISLCPPVSGQIGVDLLVDPPKPGSPSYDLYEQETSMTHENLKSRSSYMVEKFNALPGISCQRAEGAMYLFPRIDMPPKALERAQKEGKAADVIYALDLLDATGICAVAGSGFGQEEGTHHLRVTALCPGVEEYMSKIENFHVEWMDKHS